MAASNVTPRLESLGKDRQIFQWLKGLPESETKFYPHALEPWQSLPINPPQPPAGGAGAGGQTSSGFWKWVGIGAEKRN